MPEPLYVYALLDRRVAPPTLSGVRLGSEQGQSGVRVGSERGRSGVRRRSAPPFRRIEIVEVGGVFAAVERLSDAPVVSEKTLREQHQIVVRLARTAKAILPVRFGTWLEREELERVVRTREAVLRQALRDVYGKAQMTLRVFGPPTPKPSSPTPSSGTEYLRARAALNTPPLPKIARSIVEAVRPLVSAETRDAGRGTVRMTINHLIDRKAASRYLTIVEPLIRTPSAPGLRSPVSGPRSSVTVSGPWPPFAFVPDLLSSIAPLEGLTP